MANFFIQRNKNYTTICNVALRDKNLSLKAKGLYAFITSLPSDWDYTIKGLVAVLKEGYEAIMNALNELESNGYLKRAQYRNAKGQYDKIAYIVLEEPNEENETVVGKPDFGKVNAKRNTSYLTKEREKTFNKKERRYWDKTPHFANEREYTTEELNALIDNVDDIVF